MMKLFAKFHKIKFKKDKINLDKKKTIRKNKLKKTKGYQCCQDRSHLLFSWKSIINELISTRIYGDL